MPGRYFLEYQNLLEELQQTVNAERDKLSLAMRNGQVMIPNQAKVLWDSSSQPSADFTDFVDQFIAMAQEVLGNAFSLDSRLYFGAIELLRHMKNLLRHIYDIRTCLGVLDHELENQLDLTSQKPSPNWEQVKFHYDSEKQKIDDKFQQLTDELSSIGQIAGQLGISSIPAMIDSWKSIEIFPWGQNRLTNPIMRCMSSEDRRVVIISILADSRWTSKQRSQLEKYFKLEKELHRIFLEWQQAQATTASQSVLKALYECWLAKENVFAALILDMQSEVSQWLTEKSFELNLLDIEQWEEELEQLINEKLALLKTQREPLMLEIIHLERAIALWLSQFLQRDWDITVPQIFSFRGECLMDFFCNSPFATDPVLREKIEQIESDIHVICILRDLKEQGRAAPQELIELCKRFLLAVQPHTSGLEKDEAEQMQQVNRLVIFKEIAKDLTRLIPTTDAHSEPFAGKLMQIIQSICQKQELKIREIIEGVDVADRGVLLGQFYKIAFDSFMTPALQAYCRNSPENLTEPVRLHTHQQKAQMQLCHQHLLEMAAHYNLEGDPQLQAYQTFVTQQILQLSCLQRLFAYLYQRKTQTQQRLAAFFSDLNQIFSLLVETCRMTKSVDDFDVYSGEAYLNLAIRFRELCAAIKALLNQRGLPKGQHELDDFVKILEKVDLRALHNALCILHLQDTEEEFCSVDSSGIMLDVLQEDEDASSLQKQCKEFDQKTQEFQKKLVDSLLSQQAALALRELESFNKMAKTLIRKANRSAMPITAIKHMVSRLQCLKPWLVASAESRLDQQKLIAILHQRAAIDAQIQKICETLFLPTGYEDSSPPIEEVSEFSVDVEKKQVEFQLQQFQNDPALQQCLDEMQKDIQWMCVMQHLLAGLAQFIQGLPSSNLPLSQFIMKLLCSENFPVLSSDELHFVLISFDTIEQYTSNGKRLLEAVASRLSVADFEELVSVLDEQEGPYLFAITPVRVDLARAVCARQRAGESDGMLLEALAYFIPTPEEVLRQKIYFLTSFLANQMCWSDIDHQLLPARLEETQLSEDVGCLVQQVVDDKRIEEDGSLNSQNEMEDPVCWVGVGETFFAWTYRLTDELLKNQEQWKMLRENSYRAIADHAACSFDFAGRERGQEVCTMENFIESLIDAYCLWFLEQKAYGQEEASPSQTAGLLNFPELVADNLLVLASLLRQPTYQEKVYKHLHAYLQKIKKSANIYVDVPTFAIQHARGEMLDSCIAQFIDALQGFLQEAGECRCHQELTSNHISIASVLRYSVVYMLPTSRTKRMQMENGGKESHSGALKQWPTPDDDHPHKALTT